MKMQKLELKEKPKVKPGNAKIFTEKEMLIAVEGCAYMTEVGRRLQVSSHVARSNICYYQSVIDRFNEQMFAIDDMANFQLGEAIKNGDLAICKWHSSLRSELYAEAQRELSKPVIIINTPSNEDEEEINKLLNKNTEK